MKTQIASAKHVPLLPALVSCKCPKCRVGKVYEHNAYQFINNKMLNRCLHCGLVYEKVTLVTYKEIDRAYF